MTCLRCLAGVARVGGVLCAEHAHMAALRLSRRRAARLAAQAAPVTVQHAREAARQAAGLDAPTTPVV